MGHGSEESVTLREGEGVRERKVKMALRHE